VRIGRGLSKIAQAMVRILAGADAEYTPVARLEMLTADRP
jgi:hypothetical protein